jgi:hypothetical protein
MDNPPGWINGPTGQEEERDPVPVKTKIII